MRETVLVIENDRNNASLFKRWLERYGYRVIEQDNGSDVKILLEQMHPDLILMDLGLHGLDGWSLTSELKANPHTRDIPVIAVTAHALPEDRLKALNAGCDEYISKPVDFLLLFSAIERLLARSHRLSSGHAH